MAFLKECPYCGKIYKSKRFYKLHIKTHKEPKVIETTFHEAKIEEAKEAEIKEPKKVIEKPKQIKIQYRQVVYVGTADKSTARGMVTGKKYEFFKDKYGMPKPTKVDEKDYPGIIALKGKGCARRDPNALFMSKQDWDLEIVEAGTVNR